jgi:hypothetical protein
VVVTQTELARSDEEAIIDTHLSNHDSEDDSGDHEEPYDNGEDEDDQESDDDDDDAEDDDAENDDAENDDAEDIVAEEDGNEAQAGAVALSSEEDVPCPRLKETSTAVRVRITRGGEQKYWMEHSREKVVNCAPSPTKKFILYLPLTPINTGSKFMIDSDINLQELALRRGGPEQYSKDMAKTFNENHRKAKTQLNRSLVLGLTDPLSNFLMVENVRHGRDGPMKLAPQLAHLESVENLRSLFNSDHLYTDQKVHNLWVGLFASGVVYGCKRAGPLDTLDMIMDVDYEAHARYEMFSRLTCQGWRHGYTREFLAGRSVEFRKIRKLVRLDRLNNLKAAEAKRLNTSIDAVDEQRRQEALGSGGLADTTDEEDGF